MIDSLYKQFQAERDAVIKDVKDKIPKFERFFSLSLANNIAKDMKKDNKLPYFSYDYLTSIEHLQKYFQVIVSVGQRNIGKSTNSYKMMQETVEKGKQFVLFRLSVSEADAVIDSENDGWFKNNGWHGTKKSGIVKDIESKEIVGYVMSLSGIQKKSIQFPEVGLVVFDEFDAAIQKNLYEKFSKIITTIQRHKHIKIFMSANYDNGNNPFLAMLGIPAQKELPLLSFNWHTSVCMWFIKDGTFHAFKNKKNLGYRLSLENFTSWLSQWSDGYVNRDVNHLISMSEVRNIVPVYNLIWGDFSYLISLIKDGEQIYVIKYHSDKVPSYCFNDRDSLTSDEYQLKSYKTLKPLIKYWQKKQVKTSTPEVRNEMKMILAFAMKKNRE